MVVFCIVFIMDAKCNAEKSRIVFVAIISMNFSSEGVEPTDFESLYRFVGTKNIEDNLGEFFQWIRIFIPKIEISLSYRSVTF